MTKTFALKRLKEIYEKFNNNLKHTMHFQLKAPKSIQLYEIDRALAMAKLRLEWEDNKTILEDLEKEADIISEIPKIVHPMAIVYAIAHFEVFIADLVKLLYNYFPKALSSKDKNLTYDTLLQYESLKDLMDELIEVETNTFSFKSIKQRIIFMEKKFGLKFKYDVQKGIRANWNSVEMEDLVEIHSTRNLIVHNNSIVNKFYLNDNPHTELKVGSKRIVDNDYAIHALFVLVRVSSSFNSVIKKKINGEK